MKKQHQHHEHETHHHQSGHEEHNKHTHGEHHHHHDNVSDKDKHVHHEHHEEHDHHGGHGGGHGGHGGHHEHMIEDFKKRFWVSLVLAIPISYLSEMTQMLFGYEVNFTGDRLLLFLLSTIIFLYGGKPFLFGAWDELKSKNPGMMMLISLAIIAAYVYSSLTVFFIEGSDFFFELATLIVIMLLGHWIEMKSIMGASKALEELIKLMPKEAHKIDESGNIVEVSVEELVPGDRILVKSGEKSHWMEKSLKENPLLTSRC